MKKITFLAIVFFSLLFFRSPLCFAQDWVSMMHDYRVNVYDVQKAFNQWRAKYGKDGGSESPGKKMDDENIENYYRWERYALKHADAAGNRTDPRITVEEYNKEIALKKKNKRAETASNWTYDGLPAISGQTIGNGRVNRLVFYPGNDSILYACSPSGGLWKTTNMGASWTTNTDLLPDLGTSDMAIDPVNPNIMYLATGDIDGYAVPTVGVLKSVDGGNTWDTTGLYWTMQTSGPGYYETSRLLISPINDSIIYAGTNQGLYYSTNMGLTWTRILVQSIRDIQFEPFHPLTIYVGTDYGTFFRCTNGKTFTQITTGLPSSGAGRIGVAVSPADSNVVYVTAVNATTYTFDGLYLSTDRGQTFTAQSTSPNIFGWSLNGTDGTGQAWYDLCLTVSPTNTDSIYAAGPNIWLSTDKGVTWTNMTYGIIHVDDHHLVYAPGSSSMLFLAEDGGVYQSTNAGSTWNNISSNIDIGQEYYIGLSADNPDYNISGWQDNGTNLNNNGTWETMDFAGDGLDCFVDYTNDNTMYGATYLGGYYYTNDGGVSWDSINNGITESHNGTGPFMEDPQTPGLLFAGIKNVWEFDGSSSWYQESSWGDNYITAMAIAPNNDLCIYAAEVNSSYRDSLFTTINGGINWINISNGLPITIGNITGITIDPLNQQRVWVTFGGYNGACKVYQSVNGGATWTNISVGLPNLPVNCVAYQPGSPDAIYIGTDIGVFYHDTLIGNWVSYNNGLPNVMVDDIRIYAPDNIVFVATYGRGTWQSPTYIPVGINNLTLPQFVKVYPNPTNGNITLSMEMPRPGEYSVSINSVLGDKLYEDKVQVQGKYEKQINLQGYSKGVYFVTIAGNNAKTVKKVVVY